MFHLEQFYAAQLWKNPNAISVYISLSWRTLKRLKGAPSDLIGENSIVADFLAGWQNFPEQNIYFDQS